MARSAPTAKTKSKAKELHRTKRRTIRDRLGHLTIRQAEKLLGEDGSNRLKLGGRITINPSEEIEIFGDTLRAVVHDPDLSDGPARVTIVEKSNRTDGLQFNCDRCGTICEHVAATLHCVLESKLTLGLSELPDPHEPLELLSEKELVARALNDRQVRADKERMVVTASSSKGPWTDYSVTSQDSGRTYRIALRGTQLGDSYCSCPDFRTNQLGTCKHILRVIAFAQKEFGDKKLAKPYERTSISLRVHYGDVHDSNLGLRFNLPSEMAPDVAKLLSGMESKTLTDVKKVMKLLRSLQQANEEVTVYPDAATFIDMRLLQDKLKEKSQEIRADPKNHPFRKTLLKVELLPYQLDGIAFALGAGRAILADDMGLGKTIQGIGTAELLARYADIKNVLVVCPASLKSQWAAEVARFCSRSHRVVLGSAQDRAVQYTDDTFFKIANYEQIVRDEAIVQDIQWDLIILDEGQRIKNWESKTSRTFNMLRSRFALVLSGTPLENRLEELFTVVRFIDSNQLGPAYRFLHRHRMVTDEGRIAGYKNLDTLRESLKPILLRRTRESVMQQLPERTTEIVRIRPTDEQKNLSLDHCQRAKQIAAKSYLTEMDLLMLQKHLLMARMAADSTVLVDKQQPGFSSKLEMLDELLEQLADEDSRKIIVFSEWTGMLDLIEPLLAKHGIQSVRLEGKVPQKKRQELVHRFQTDPKCRAIIMTNAGSTGLNLQAANTVINVDLPWNPAILEQRIARAHRMGQKRPVQVFVLVTEETIEDRMLGTLAAKQDLACAALDIDNELTEVQLGGTMEELRRRLERLLGEKPTTPIDDSMMTEVDREAESMANKREKVAAASGELLGAALKLVSQLLDQGQPTADPTVVNEVTQNLAQCVERDASGRPQLRITLSDDNALSGLAQTLAKLLITKS